MRRLFYQLPVNYHIQNQSRKHALPSEQLDLTEKFWPSRAIPLEVTESSCKQLLTKMKSNSRSGLKVCNLDTQILPRSARPHWKIAFLIISLLAFSYHPCSKNLSRLFYPPISGKTEEHYGAVFSQDSHWSDFHLLDAMGNFSFCSWCNSSTLPQPSLLFSSRTPHHTILTSPLRWFQHLPELHWAHSTC